MEKCIFTSSSFEQIKKIYIRNECRCRRIECCMSEDEKECVELGMTKNNG